MKQRPIIKLELTTTDKAIELLGWISIMAIWLLTIINYTNLTICTSFYSNSLLFDQIFASKKMMYW